MTNSLKSQQEQELRAQVELVRGRLEGLAAELRAVDDEVESLAPQRKHHELLEQACGSVEKLDELGAASLFWGERIDPARVEAQLQEVRSRVSAFQSQMNELDARRQAILARISDEEEMLAILGDDLYDFWEQEERRKLEWVVEREISPVSNWVQAMAWARSGEEDLRFRKWLAASLWVSLVFGALLPMIDLPLPKPFQPDAIPRRLVQLVRRTGGTGDTGRCRSGAETVRAARSTQSRDTGRRGGTECVRAARGTDRAGDTGLSHRGTAKDEGRKGWNPCVPRPVREPGKGQGRAASRSRCALA
jgi:hypothetical protein